MDDDADVVCWAIACTHLFRRKQRRGDRPNLNMILAQQFASAICPGLSAASPPSSNLPALEHPHELINRSDAPFPPCSSLHRSTLLVFLFDFHMDRQRLRRAACAQCSYEYVLNFVVIHFIRSSEIPAIYANSMRMCKQISANKSWPRSLNSISQTTLYYLNFKQLFK
jgi:hypothetical protein